MDHAPSLTHSSHNVVNLLVDERARDHGVVVAFSSRAGGVSPAPFDTLNLSARSADAAANVTENRTRLTAAGGFDTDSLVFARQVHGACVLEAADLSSGPIEGDALVADASGTTLGVLTADCVPVMVAGEAGIAAIHAGWRGIVAGVIPAALEKLGGATLAWVGPSIHACCYEVGPDVTSAFTEQALPIADAWHVDPSHAAVMQLRRAGVDRIAASPICTSCDPRYFSYRRDRETGRQGGFIALA